MIDTLKVFLKLLHFCDYIILSYKLMRGVIKNVVRSKVKKYTSLDDQKHKCMQWSHFQSNYILYKL